MRRSSPRGKPTFLQSGRKRWEREEGAERDRGRCLEEGMRSRGGQGERDWPLMILIFVLGVLNGVWWTAAECDQEGTYAHLNPWSAYWSLQRAASNPFIRLLAPVDPAERSVAIRRLLQSPGATLQRIAADAVIAATTVGNSG